MPLAAALPPTDPLLTLALVLVAGLLSGALVKRVHLPAVTGQILVGVLAGPSVLGFFGSASVHVLEPLIDFALALMAVAVGSHLHLRRLANAKKRLAWLLLFEACLTPLLVFGLLVAAPRMSWSEALLLATISISTAPATILALVKETRAKGVFVKTLVAAVALNNLACICLFELARTAALTSLVPGAAGSLWDVLLAPARSVLVSALVGAGVGGMLILLTRRIVRSDRLAAASFAAILLTAGLAAPLGASTLLSCLFLGVALANFSPDKEEVGHAVFANFESAIFAVFFTLAGIELRFDYIVPGGLAALLLFAGRFAGKLASASLSMRLAGATDALRRHLGPALIPQAGLAVGLMLLVTEDPSFAPIRGTFLAVVLSVVLANELIGPVLTRTALRKSGDAGKDRARLLDFLHEEHILTGLEAASKEDAIRKLTDHLLKTHAIKAGREALLQGILAREREESTCVGQGLALPHGPLPDGASMAGVMGINRHGFDFVAPDGRPVHCIVLLATPPGQQDRHLEVLAALARAIGTNRSIRQQIYHAESAAHVYDLLHAEEAAEDFNYFL